jgi:hypothetical protein
LSCFLLIFARFLLLAGWIYDPPNWRLEGNGLAQGVALTRFSAHFGPCRLVVAAA